MTGPASALRALLERNRAGEAVGITSVCSAHPLVLEAAALQASADGTLLLVEATSNQVDQFGGYTGQRPADFRDAMLAIADEVGLPRERVVLGGDHLGPNRWRDLGAEQAMAHSDDLVAAYVSAGFAKIHLDCSMSCTGDPGVLDDETVAARAARLAVVAERAATESGLAEPPVYVVGTEVPVPGGAAETISELTPTSPDAARRTIAAHRRAFAAAGVAGAWERVIGLVVQPGVEFDHLQVVDYRRERTRELQRVLDGEGSFVFEAHSTDYQTEQALTALVEDHWGILKVGPGLTFSLREGLFALAQVELELVGPQRASHLPDVVESVMLAEPGYWQRYYEGDDAAQRLARRYSYSDRVRYYWPHPKIQRAQAVLIENLSKVGIPVPMLSQVLPSQYWRVRHGQLTDEPAALLVDKVRDVLRSYARACGTRTEEKATP